MARAFRSFTEAAGSLERTYGQLQGQVAHLRQELEVTNRNLTVSLEENRRMRERLRRILEGLPCGVLVLEGEKRIATLNPEARRLFGGNFDSVDKLPPALARALASARESGEEQEIELPRGAEGTIWVAVRHAWLEQNSDKKSSVFILRDTSVARQLERARENLRRQQALVEMSALLAHEIRNPLGSLELFAGLLAESGLEDEKRRWIEHVQAGLRSLSSTVNNVLDLHNEPPPERATMDAGELLGWAYDFCCRWRTRRGWNCRSSTGYAVCPLLRTGICWNRCCSIWHSMRCTSCRVADGWPCRGAMAARRDRDRGAGHGGGNFRRRFAARVRGRVHDASGVAGLGLAVCRRIPEQHGGSIEAESKAGHGATFRVRLPAALPSAGAIAPPMIEDSAGSAATGVHS